MWTVLSLPFATGCNMGVDIICKVLRTVKARGLYSCSRRSYQLVSVKYMIMNIISHTCAPYYPYTESQALGKVNKEAVCWSINRHYKGFSRVSANSTKVTEPPEYIGASQLRMSTISTLWTASGGHEKVTINC